MKLFGFFRKMTGATEYGRQIGRTANDGTKIFSKSNKYGKEITTLDVDSNVKKVINDYGNGNLDICDILEVNRNITRYQETSVRTSHGGKVKERDVVIREKTTSEDGGSSTKTVGWVSQSKTVTNEKGDRFMILTTAAKPEGVGAEFARNLSYPRRPLASSAWWQWFINGKPVSMGEFLRNRTMDIIRLI